MEGEGVRSPPSGLKRPELQKKQRKITDSKERKFFKCLERYFDVIKKDGSGYKQARISV